jgi:trehalose 6-phosphate synthase/phosphatase
LAEVIVEQTMSAVESSYDRLALRESKARAHRDQARLLVMSNRAPVKIVRENGHERVEPTVGGVGSTFLRLLERHGGLWIAWSGIKDDARRIDKPSSDAPFSMLFPRLTERDIAFYYHGMCNRGLWPLMHFMPLNCRFETAQWHTYCRVNRVFARAAELEADSYDIIWVQDFHLALVPQHLRERNPKVPIGLFWHVPWPPEQVFRIFPWRAELLTGMLGSDLIGFHTPSYAKHFLDGCERILNLKVDRETNEVYHDSRSTKVGSFPLGIAADLFSEIASTSESRARARRIRKALRTPIVALGVDRLDYTKGIIERLLGFERFLELYPEYRRRITLVLIAVPSRTRVTEYSALKKQVDELVGRVVGRFSSDGWVPIRYLYTQFQMRELIAYYQSADIALVTPLRDGMNMVAKEYIASHPADSAVLILSEFAGAAEELSSALLVNPYNIDQIAERLHQAVEMPIEERRARFAELRERVHRNDLEAWSQRFLSVLREQGALEPDAQLAAQ